MLTCKRGRGGEGEDGHAGNMDKPDHDDRDVDLGVKGVVGEGGTFRGRRTNTPAGYLDKPYCL